MCAVQQSNIAEDPMGKTATLNLRVDAELKAELSKIAKQQDRTPSYIAEQAIKDRIAFEQAQVRAIEEGLAAAERGEFISHEQVVKWVRSLGTDNPLPRPTVQKKTE